MNYFYFFDFPVRVIEVFFDRIVQGFESSLTNSYLLGLNFDLVYELNRYFQRFWLDFFLLKLFVFPYSIEKLLKTYIVHMPFLSAVAESKQHSAHVAE